MFLDLLDLLDDSNAGLYKLQNVTGQTQSCHRVQTGA